MKFITWGFIALSYVHSDVSGPSACNTTISRRNVDWKSGVSQDVDPEAFGSFRNRLVDIIATYTDRGDANILLWPLRQYSPFEIWQGDMVMSVGAFETGTWADAANGAMDEHWKNSLTRMSELWGDKPGTLYIRFAHEFNRIWYPWKVNQESVTDFKTAWGRYRNLQKEIFPNAKLVFPVNCASSPEHGGIWYDAFPGSDLVDVIDISYYNRHPVVHSAASFDNLANAKDQFGASGGLYGHLEFARQQGLPFAVSEWGADSNHGGDLPVFIDLMFEFFAKNAGSGPGQVLFECYFNIDKDGNAFQLFPNTRHPNTAARYQELWGGH